MSLKTSKIYFAILIVVLAIACQACDASQKTMSAATDPSTEHQSSPVESPTSLASTADIQNSFLPATATPTIAVMPSPTRPTVMVIAVNGDLSIRSGPDETFDAIAVLRKGETVPALARSILNGWVQVPIPFQEGKTGWVSILTDYSIVSGNVLDLSRIDVVEWPVGSYLLNCTTHQMVVEPGDKTLQRVSDSPKNRVWLSPGLYTVYDLDVSGHPQVKNLSLPSHTEVKIIKDGDGQRSECP